MEILGIDVGGTGIKGAVVNTKTGELISKRRRIATPHPATPEAVAETIQKLIHHFNHIFIYKSKIYIFIFISFHFISFFFLLIF